MVAGAFDSLMRLEEVEDRENKDPNKVDEVPEKATNLDAIGHMFGILTVEPFAVDEEVQEHQGPGEHVQTMESGDGEIDGEIRTVFGNEGAPGTDIGGVNRHLLLAQVGRDKMR